MSSRRTSSPSVSLFPFLAVLVCAMGALIFLLLVATRRIREQTVERAQAAESAAVIDEEQSTGEPVFPEAPEEAAAEEPDEALAVLVAPPAPEPVELPPPPEPVELPPPPVAPEPPNREAEAEALRLEWERAVSALERELAAAAVSAAAWADAADREESALANAQSRIAELDRERGRVQSEQGRVEQSARIAAARAREVEGQIAMAQQELNAARTEQAQAESRFRILPYDGRLGTVRRPIIIECTEHGLTFASEEITLTAEQLNGFPPIRNPLLAGANALINYWTAKDFQSAQTGDSTGQPYVLLIVRPRGSVAYYVARRLLESMKSPFGYELVGEAQEFDWPETDRAAAEVCRLAIETVLQERERLLARTSTGRLPVAEQLRFVDAEGRFFLEEVERLRSGGKTVHFGGREWDRSPQARTPTAVEASPGRRVIEFPRNGRTTGGEIAPHSESIAPPSNRNPGGGLYDAQVGRSEDRQFGTPGRRDAGAWEAAGRASGSTDGNGARESERPGRPGGSGGNSESPDSVDPGNPSVFGGRGTSRLDPASPPFSRPTPNGRIGLEREVLVRVNNSSVLVENEPPILITSGMSREALQRELAITLDGHIRGWGDPPQSFDWAPAVRFQILPGGNQYQERLSSLVDEWGLRVRTEHVLE